MTGVVTKAAVDRGHGDDLGTRWSRDVLARREAAASVLPNVDAPRVHRWPHCRTQLKLPARGSGEEQESNPRPDVSRTTAPQCSCFVSRSPGLSKPRDQTQALRLGNRLRPER